MALTAYCFTWHPSLLLTRLFGQQGKNSDICMKKRQTRKGRTHENGHNGLADGGGGEGQIKSKAGA